MMVNGVVQPARARGSRVNAAPYAFLEIAGGPDPAEGRPEHLDWLVGCGVPFVPELWNEPSWEAPTGYGLMYTGGENARSFADPLFSAVA